MLTSKQRAELRGRANSLEVTLMIGKEGITDSVIHTASGQMETRELIKGRVLETAGMTARECSDQLCELTGADGVQCVGGTFVIYRKSRKLETQRAQAKAKERAAKKKINPVRAGIQRRKAAAKRQRERRDEFFRQQREKERKGNR